LFFINLLLRSVNTALGILRCNKYVSSWNKKHQTVLNTMIYLQSILFIQLVRFSHRHLNYNKKIFQSRLPLFNVYAKILLFTMQKTTFIPTNRQLIIRFLALNNRNLCAQFLVNYLILNLRHYNELSPVLYPVINRYKQQPNINGFKFIISGRLTRKERAAYIVRSHKSVPLSTLNVKIDYASDFIIMRFGIVGIKIYLLLSDITPYYYFFEFKNKIEYNEGVS